MFSGYASKTLAGGHLSPLAHKATGVILKGLTCAEVAARESLSSAHPCTQGLPCMFIEPKKLWAGYLTKFISWPNVTASKCLNSPPAEPVSSSPCSSPPSWSPPPHAAERPALSRGSASVAAANPSTVGANRFSVVVGASAPPTTTPLFSVLLSSWRSNQLLCDLSSGTRNTPPS